MNIAETAVRAEEFKSSSLENMLPLRLPTHFNASSSHIYLSHVGLSFRAILDSVDFLLSLMSGC